MRKTIHYRTPKIKKINLKSIFLSFFFKLFVIVSVGGIVYLIFFSSFFKIKNVIVEGNQEIKQEQIEELLNKTLENTILGSNLGYNLIFVPKEKIKKDIGNNFLIKNINIIKKWPNQLIIKIEERKPALIWIAKDKYFIDDDGFVLKKVDSEINLPTIIDKKQIEISEGQKIVSQEFVRFIKDLYKNLPLKTPYTIDSILIEEVTFDIEVRTQQGIVLYLTTQNSLESQINHLKASLEEIEKRGDRVIYYIDLRLNDKVFYK